MGTTTSAETTDRTITRARIEKQAATYGSYLGSSQFATTITPDVHEAMQRHVDDCDPLPQGKRARGPIDGRHTSGTVGYQYKLRSTPTIRVDQEFFADLDEIDIIMPGEMPAGRQLLHTLIDYCRADGHAVRQLANRGSAAALGALVVEQAVHSLEQARREHGVSRVVLAITIRSRDEHRFAQVNQTLELPKAEDLKWSWANSAKRTLIGRDRRTGDRVIQWASSGGQVKLDIYCDPAECARFRVDWEPAS